MKRRDRSPPSVLCSFGDPEAKRIATRLTVATAMEWATVPACLMMC